MDIDLDFDLSDFDLIDKLTEDLGYPPEAQQRILRPRMDSNEIMHRVMFANAEEFADQIDLNERTFAWVSGNFIFGDVLEALITRRRVGVKKVYISSLSISYDNIDSLKNVLLLMGEELEKMVILLSGFIYSRHKFDVIPYLYEQLDDKDNRVQIAFGRYHAKIITLETVNGNTLTIHGSANLPSSNSIEQIMVEPNNRQLHQFNADIMDDIAARFGTINHKAGYHKLKIPKGQESYMAALQFVKE